MYHLALTLFIKVKYDYETAGFTDQAEAPFRFFVNQCYVHSSTDANSLKVFIIGDALTPALDRCPSMIAENYLNFVGDASAATFTNETYFGFDAFTFKDAD